MNTPFRPAFFTAALVAVFLAAAGSHATIVKSLSLDQLAKNADVIVHGTVDRQTSSWNDARNRIYTVTEVRVEEALKGDLKRNEVIVVRQLGGTVDGISQVISGNAQLAEAEEVLVFLRADPEKSLHYVVGMAQGKYAVDRGGPDVRVVRNLRGIALVNTKDGQIGQILSTPQPLQRQQSPTLEQFKATVRSALGNRGVGR